jgi:hypothetical protein
MLKVRQYHLTTITCCTGRHWIGGKKGEKYYWDSAIIFGKIRSFAIIGNDETNVSVVARTSTYRD